jgi:excisionase family DNA binding protein
MKAGRASKPAPASKPRKIDATHERRESSSQSLEPTQPTGPQLEYRPSANLLPLRAKVAGVGCPVHEHTGTDYGIRIITRASSGRSDPLDRSPAPTRKSGPPVRSNALQRHFSIEAVAEALDVSSRTVRRWIARGNLAVLRINGVIRISERDLAVFLARYRDER